MGLGEKGIIKIPATSNFNMDISVLEEYYQKAVKNGIEVFAIIGSAPSTAVGIYDDLVAIAVFSKKHDLWFHVDGAHGGASIFSPKYQHTVKGIDQADSVVIDGHKMMMMPTITTALLYKDGNHSHTTFNQKADYLLEQSEDEDWYNLAKRTFECTKTMMSIQWYTILKTYGAGIFDEYVTTLYDLGHQFGEMIENNPHFNLAVKPMSNIVCFRFIDDSLSIPELNKINENIRRQLLENGEFYIVQTKLNGVHYLRTTIMNPFTTKEHLNKLLDRIRTLAK
jgi:L-2,4-diaminobutyrate decarboxylase